VESEGSKGSAPTNDDRIRGEAMEDSGHVLALFADNKGQVFLHADDKGLEILISRLERLRGHLRKGECDHEHLMTDAWAGDGDLTELDGIEDEGNPVHHLKIYGWTDERAKEYGFLK
jgi:hypothetical protein